MTQFTIEDAMARYPESPGYKEPTTSKEAAERVAGTSEAARGMILSLLWTKPPMSADQIAAHFGWTVLYTRPRVSELHKMNAIKKAGRVTNASGLSAWAWTIA
jgi:ParB-like chromosome segregation protein Spo0J